jgi:hypothetical protein
MSKRQSFPHLNELFDVKHIWDDLNNGGLADPKVYALAAELHRLLVTYNLSSYLLPPYGNWNMSWHITLVNDAM